MDVILDSNIFRSDFLLKNSLFDALNDYLIKTSSSLVIPEIVLDEVLELYKNEYTSKLKTAKKAIKSFNGIGLTQLTVPNEEKNIAEIVDEYKNMLLTRFKNVEILQYNNDHYQIVVNRLIEKRKPGGQKGQGYRDTIIWLSILDHSKTKKPKLVAFVSNNTSDFADRDKVKLHPELINDCEKNQVSIAYFPNLNDLIEKQSSKISFIDAEWIFNKYPIEDFAYLIKDEAYFEKSAIVSELSNFVGGYIEDADIIGASIGEIEEIFVYETIDDSYIVNISLRVTLEMSLLISNKFYESQDEEFFWHDENIVALASISFEVKNLEIINESLTDLSF